MLIKHGMCGSVEHDAWKHMRQRCLNSKDHEYHNYGGRGISICERWSKFTMFLKDMGFRPNKNLTLERCDNEKGYSPGNCYWASKKQQSRNRRVLNSLGERGVHQVPSGKYKAQIWWENKTIHLGTFNTIEEAAARRRAAECEYGWNL